MQVDLKMWAGALQNMKKNEEWRRRLRQGEPLCFRFWAVEPIIERSVRLR